MGRGTALGLMGIGTATEFAVWLLMAAVVSFGSDLMFGVVTAWRDGVPSALGYGAVVFLVIVAPVALIAVASRRGARR